MSKLLRFLSALALVNSTAWAGGPPSFQVHHSAQGNILADASGMTLYTFDGDGRYRPKCAGECAMVWRPFAVPQGGKHGVGYWSVIGRPDGVVQWAYGGRPLYTFRGDLLPGDINGERYDNGRWHAARVLCMPADAQGRLRDGPVVELVDAALEAGVAPLRELRRWCDVDLDELAERSGTNVAVIAAYEEGRGKLSLPELASVASALGVPVYLLSE